MIKTSTLVHDVITITFDNSESVMKEYRGESFTYHKSTETEDAYFVDWVNGGLRNPVEVGPFTINEPAFDVKMMGRELTNTVTDYVRNKVYQRLYIHQGELNYKFENVENVGIPYLNKLTKDELDLLIKDTLTSTIGVLEISKFESRAIRVDEAKYKQGLTYIAEFEVKIETGERLWQSIEI